MLLYAWVAKAIHKACPNWKTKIFDINIMWNDLEILYNCISLINFHEMAILIFS